MKSDTCFNIRFETSSGPEESNNVLSILKAHVVLLRLCPSGVLSAYSQLPHGGPADRLLYHYNIKGSRSHLQLLHSPTMVANPQCVALAAAKEKTGGSFTSPTSHSGANVT